MKKWLRNTLIVLAGLVIVAAAGTWFAWQNLPVNLAMAQGSGTLNDITLPDGFTIDYFVQDIQGARSMTLSEGGTLFVGTRIGAVYAIPNAASSTQAAEVITLASGLNSPNGVDVIDGDLYVAEIDRITRYADIDNHLDGSAETSVVLGPDSLPSDGHHGWKYLKYGPDGMLYFNVGAPCNVCELTGLYGSISRVNLDGTGLEVYSTGVRNSVGFDWHPQTAELWFTNNGRDWMGDDLPPDTLHHAPEPGLHFGFPYCHAGTIPDPDFGGRRACDEFAAPAANLTPHGAALGMIFYTGEMFPDEYTDQIFFAERGSWNRTVPIGYRVQIARLNADNTVASVEPFAEGWLNEATGQAWGRPVDVLQLPDGSLLVSDDSNHAIYRIAYVG